MEHYVGEGPIDPYRVNELKSPGGIYPRDQFHPMVLLRRKEKEGQGLYLSPEERYIADEIMEIAESAARLFLAHMLDVPLDDSPLHGPLKLK